MRIRVIYNDGKMKLIKIDQITFFPQKNKITYIPIDEDNLKFIDIELSDVKAVAVLD